MEPNVLVTIVELEVLASAARITFSHAFRRRIKAATAYATVSLFVMLRSIGSVVTEEPADRAVRAFSEARPTP